MLFRTYTHQRLEVLLAGQLLANTSLEHLAVPNGTSHLLLVVTHARLSVYRDEQPLDAIANVGAAC